jgi:signal transduction histidine kinase
MAHSIKNIMMGLDGGIYVVSKGLEAGDDAEVKEGWDMVLLNFEKVSQLVQDILYCSKEREPNFQKVRPNDVLKEVYDLFLETARSYDISFKLELDERLGEAVVDPKGLHTVLSNLVTNAIDACRVDIWQDSNEVVLRSKRGSDGSIIIEVADDGIGMEKETEGHAFEDFFTTKGQQGTGLGLMVTQKILEEHGGAISFRSRPRKGTTFTTVFPPRELEAEGTA